MIKRRGTSGVLVTFELPAVVVAASASVCGEFNEWSPRAHPMARTSSGRLQAVIELEAGRAWRFRYLLDDERWENDWTADAYAQNEFGAEDSVVDLVGLEADPSEPAGAPPHTEAPAEARDPAAAVAAEPAEVSADGSSPEPAEVAAMTRAKQAKKPSTAAAETKKAATTTAAAKKAVTKATAAAEKKTAAKKSAPSAAATKEATKKSDAPIEKSAAKKAVPRKSAGQKADTKRIR